MRKYNNIFVKTFKNLNSFYKLRKLPSTRYLTGNQFLQNFNSSNQANQRLYGTRTNLVTPENILLSPTEDVDIPETTLHELIFSKCDEFHDKIAVEDYLLGNSYTYQQLKENAIKVASVLHKKGYKKGDIITVFTTNTIDFPVLFLASSCLGLIFSPANPTYTPGELARQLNVTKSKAIFSAPFLVDVVKKALVHKDLPNSVKDCFSLGASDFHNFQDLLQDSGLDLPSVDVDASDVLTLPFSSGTTGLPKGVMLTHKNITTNGVQTDKSIGFPVSSEDNFLGLLPMFHAFGLLVIQLGAFLRGAKIVTLPKFEPKTFLSCIQDKRITLAHLVPPLLIFLAKEPMTSQYNVKSLQKIISAAAPLGNELTKEFIQKYGNIIRQGYGLTETSPVATLDASRDGKHGSIGTMVVNTQGKIVDIETGKTLGPGQSGEFCIKGPQVMKGYYNNQSATDEMIRDGWLHSGDIGYFTEDGNVYIQDRLKELIKVKGQQVAPAELEALLLSNPEVQDVGVIGVADEQAGELPKAFVVRKPGSSVTEEEIKDFVKENLSSHKQLKGGVSFVEAIPRNASGKILRRSLKNMD